jgi:hypothetical protein
MDDGTYNQLVKLQQVAADETLSGRLREMANEIAECLTRTGQSADLRAELTGPSPDGRPLIELH